MDCGPEYKSYVQKVRAEAKEQDDVALGDVGMTMQTALTGDAYYAAGWDQVWLEATIRFGDGKSTSAWFCWMAGNQLVSANDIQEIREGWYTTDLPVVA